MAKAQSESGTELRDYLGQYLFAEFPIVDFDGMKESGYGRESELQAMYDYTRAKTVWVNTSDEVLGSQFVAR